MTRSRLLPGVAEKPAIKPPEHAASFYRQQLMAHELARPENQDILAITRWAHEKEAIRLKIAAAELAERRGKWTTTHPVHNPDGAPTAASKSAPKNRKRVIA